MLHMRPFYVITGQLLQLCVHGVVNSYRQPSAQI